MSIFKLYHIHCYNRHNHHPYGSVVLKQSTVRRLKPARLPQRVNVGGFNLKLTQNEGLALAKSKIHLTCTFNI